MSSDIRPELENVVGAMKRRQQDGPPASSTTAPEESGTIQHQKMAAPQASPNMNAEMASAAAAEFKKKEKRIQKAVAELEGEPPKQSSCCAIL